MALPRTAKEPIEVKSVEVSGRSYWLLPITLANRPRVNGLVSVFTLQNRENRNKMHLLRQLIDFSPYFEADECEQIRTVSAEMLNPDSWEIESEDRDILAKADMKAILVSPEYQELAIESNRIQHEGDIRSLSYFLVGVTENGIYNAADDPEDALGFIIEEVKSKDFDLLISASRNLALLSEETEKNLEPASTSV